MKPQFEKDSGGAVIPCSTKPGQGNRVGIGGVRWGGGCQDNNILPLLWAFGISRLMLFGTFAGLTNKNGSTVNVTRLRQQTTIRRNSPKKEKEKERKVIYWCAKFPLATLSLLFQ